MRIYWTLMLFILALAHPPEEEVDYPKDYFIAPVYHSIQLSGTFGELRPNHFHSGIDIRGKTGDPILAAAEGYISRIKIQSGGYGNAVYIAHPNGYTTVYAHLHKLSPELATYVKNSQYALKSFTLDLNVDPSKFQVKKGQQIGELGTSGRSFGPHLHFEIRSASNQKPLNPLLFGLPFKDKEAPLFHEVKIYYLNKEMETVHSEIIPAGKVGQSYELNVDTVDCQYDRIGVAVKVFDHMNGGANKNGIHSLTMKVDSQVIHTTEWDRFSFGESRYINAHLDYAEQVSNRAYFNKCFKIPGNKLSLYKNIENDGVILLPKGASKNVELIAKDSYQNTSKLQFVIANNGNTKDFNLPNYQYKFLREQTNFINNESVQMKFMEGCFYENAYISYAQTTETSDDIYSPIHHVHKNSIPVHKYFSIKLKGSVPDSLKKKAFIAYCSSSGGITSYGGTWQGDWLTSRSQSLGDYCIMVDNTPPVISPVRYQLDMTNWEKMTFKIQDDFPTGKGQSGLKYRGRIDGQWRLFEFDAKNDLLIHRFDERTGSGSHQLEISVTDNRKNTKTFTSTFKK